MNGCPPGTAVENSAEAILIVDDGTAEAKVFVDDDLVYTLLGLRERQRRRLEELSLRTGELTYSDWVDRDSATGHVSRFDPEAELPMLVKGKGTLRRVELVCRLQVSKKDAHQSTRHTTFTASRQQHTTEARHQIALKALGLRPAINWHLGPLE